jgi:hypothetical protein
MKSASIIVLLCASLLPAAGDVCLVGGLAREVTLEPGGKSEGRIILQNRAEEPQDIKVYQTDYLFYADGRNVYGEPGSVPRSNSSWITFSPSQFVIPPKETRSVYYTIQVPPTKDLAGTFWSMLMIEPQSAAAPQTQSPEETKAEVSVRTVLRYGIQVVTDIGEMGTREMRFADRRLVVDGEKRTLELDIENTGERWLRPMVWAELYDEHGVSIGRFDGGRLRLYPGCSARFAIDLSQVPPGPYQALVVADNGDENVFGAQYKLEIR